MSNKLDDFIDDSMEFIEKHDFCELCGESDPIEIFYKDSNMDNRADGNRMALCKECNKLVQSPIKMTVFRDLSIEIAHKLPGHISCGVLHGHTINISVGIQGELDLISGMVMDFNELKRVLKEVIEDKFDHSYLNDTFYMPTSEMLSLYIFNVLKRKGYDVKLIRIHETQKNYVEFEG